MRITIVQGAFLPVPPIMGGAVEMVWFALGKEFARRGHQVVHVSRRCSELPLEELIEGVQHLRVGGFNAPPSLLLSKLLDLIYSLRALLVLPEGDILVTNTFWLPMLVHTRIYGQLYVHVARYPKGQMRFYRHAKRLQTVSKPILKAIRQEAPYLHSRICCIPNPLTDGMRVSSSLQTRKRWILYVGRIHPEKGIELLLKAMAPLSQEMLADWTLKIVGPAESKFGGGGERYLARLKNIADPARTEWIGPIFDRALLESYYREASLFVYPSLAERGETFGLAPLEAMSAACPALVSSLACFQDFITDNETGFIFDHRALHPEKELSAKIGELIRDEQRLSQVGLRAQRKAGEFKLENIANLYLRDFHALLTEARPA